MRTLLTALAHFARVAPAKPALVVSRKGVWTQFSFADLHEETERWARSWRNLCPTQGAVVFLILQHGIDMYPAFLGAMRAGLVPSFLPYPTPKQDTALYWRAHKALLARVQPACILSYAELLPALQDITADTSCTVLDIATVSLGASNAELPPAPDVANPKLTALLQHSSGTTIGATPYDRIISWLPLYHDMGLITAFLLPISLGATVISIDAFDWLTRPDMLFDEISRFRATLCWLPNFAFNHLVRTRDRDRSYDLSSMRAFIDCSEPCKPETAESFEQVFAGHGLRPNAVQVSYAMAEAVFAVTQTRFADKPRTLSVDRAAFTGRSEIVLVPRDTANALHFLSCGSPVEGAALRIVPKAGDRAWHRLSHGFAALGLGRKPPVDLVVGEIQIHGPFMFDGYFRNQAATEAAFDGAWFRTGDMGFVHQGELFVCGRLKEMLIVHGRNYYANDIEDVVNRVAGVKPGRVVALGVYDPVTATEEAVVMAETLLHGTDDAARNALSKAIRAQVFDELSLSLRRVEIADEGTLIKTTSGKLSREENIKRLGVGVFA
jgi:fatty-acyl-CoA synthase